ncbi:hypothetical protein MFLAVUS_006127 [Mucor flavus]|uniref:Uncharacterized protein n=1 Tax=Mucor flavus TaxID=439312 RepID=A0ABP9Z0P4_9FUNG
MHTIKITVNAVRTATIATDTALNLISTTYDTVDKENKPPQPSITPIENTAANVELYNDDEITIRSIAHKKISGKLSNDDLNYLKNNQSDGSPKSDLFMLSSKLRQKEKITVLNETVLELSLSEKVIEDTELRSKCDDEQEPTLYRRFASIIDLLFKGSEIILFDGETDCQSSRIAIEENKCVFTGEDTFPTYSRKIDLLLKYDEKKKDIDLCFNEWKRSKVTIDLKLKQQSRNMRELMVDLILSHSILALNV